MSNELAPAKDRTLTIVYILHALALFNGVTAVIGVIISHVSINDTNDEFLNSHHSWLIRSFWWGLLWLAVSIALMVVLIGFLGYAVIGFWWLYRIVYGIVNFVDNKPMPR